MYIFNNIIWEISLSLYINCASCSCLRTHYIYERTLKVFVYEHNVESLIIHNYIVSYIRTREQYSRLEAKCYTVHVNVDATCCLGTQIVPKLTMIRFQVEQSIYKATAERSKYVA
jgi:hypothetical protein